MNKELLLELINLALENKNEIKNDLPFEIGEKYFVRTVTHYVVGELKEITGGFLIFSNASWIADSGRFNEAIKNGTLNEVEPIKGRYIVAIGSIVDAFDWVHNLPTEVK